MLKPNVILWAIFLLLNGRSAAQGIERYYPSKGAERAFAMLPGADGGFVLAGNGQDFSGAPTDMLFIRIDAAGNLLTRQKIGLPDQYESASVLLPVQGGGFLLGGDRGPDATGFNRPLWVITGEGGHPIRVVESGLDSAWVSAGCATSDSGWILGGLHWLAGGTETAVFLNKIGPDGAEIWQKTISPGLPIDGLYGICPTPNGNYRAVGVIREETGADRDVFYLQFNEQGQILDTVILHKPGTQWANCCVSDSNGDLLVAGFQAQNGAESDAWLLRIGSDGSILSDRSYDFGERENLRSAAIDAAGDILLAGETANSGTQPRNGLLIKVNANGNLVYHRQMGGVKGDFFSAAIGLAKGRSAAAGQTASFDDGIPHVYWVRTDSSGQTLSGRVRGVVKLDQNTDCLPDGVESPAQNWLVRASGALGQRYALTDDAGNYEMPLDTGQWFLSVLPPSDYWTSCLDSVGILMLQPGSETTVDFAVQAEISCPILETTLSTPYLRRCFSNTYTVNYQNLGTATATNTWIDLVLDPYLEIQSASIPWQTAGLDSVRFYTGNIPPLEGGTFTFNAFLNCDDTQTGQTHCSTVHIYPDSTCTQFSAQWDHSNLAVSGFCAGDSVVLQVRNTGLGDMAEPAEFIITEDLIIIKNELLRLDAGRDTTFVLRPNGATVTFRVIQTPGNPGSIAPVFVIEGCAGAVNQFGIPGMYPPDDEALAVDTDCKQSIASLDPNDKTALPSGVGSMHHIQAGTDIEYLIRFQNTGTDTAFRVEIRDTLSAFLNPETVSGGISSRPYRLFQTSGGALHFVFDPIKLPDSSSNALESQGFVQFRVAQKRDLPEGTSIENRAGIYFDFNPPVMTNTVRHRIGDPKQDLGTISTRNTDPTPEIQLGISPNPVRQSARIQWKLPDHGRSESPMLEIRDPAGRLYWRQTGVKDKILFNAEHFPDGLYLLTLKAAGCAPVSIKFIKH